MNSPTRFALLLAAAALGGAAVTSALLIPSRSEALGGGASLADRITLSGTPVFHHVPSFREEQYVVPEGRRLFIYDVRFNVSGAADRRCSFRGARVYDGALNDAQAIVLRNKLPAMFGPGEVVQPECEWDRAPEAAQSLWSNFRLWEAYLL